jgi:hypothetical protein
MVGRIAMTWGCAALSLAGCAASAPMAQAGVFHRAPSRVVRDHVRQGDWRLDLARDRFSGALACRLQTRDGKAIYRAGAVGFRFDHDWDVTGAVYRIDMGPVQTMRDDLPRLLALHTPIDSGSMDNPTGGIVWVPYEKLVSPSSDNKTPVAIAIEPQRGKGARLFRFRGLAALHDTAVAKGCAPESRFVGQ